MDEWSGLIADRFLVRSVSGGPSLAPTMAGVDLSDGSAVEIIVCMCGGAAEQRRWAGRCDRFARLWHRDIARLVDYGGLGDTHRFEAWRIDAGGSAPSGGLDVLDATRQFLRACGWTAGTLDDRRVRMADARPVIVPAADTGYDDPEGPDDGVELSRERLAVAGVPHDTAAAVADVFDDPGVARCRVVSVAVPLGWGEAEVVRDLARSARLRGFVPLAPALANRATLNAVQGRAVCLITRSTAVDGWCTLLDVTAWSPGPHVLVFVGQHEEAPHPIVRVPLLAVEGLCAAVCPQPASARGRAMVAAAARAAGGLPSRFAVLLWKETAALSRVAEAPHAYGVDPHGDGAADLPVVRPWPVPGDIVQLKARVDAGIACLTAGRHAAGERLLREAGASLARRRDWHGAAEAALALAEAQVGRGRLGDADTALADARRAVAHARPTGDTLVRMAVLSGRVALARGRLDDAESTLSAAVVSARGLDLTGAVGDASVHLADCLFWRGAHDAAQRVLTDLGESPGRAAPAVVRLAAARAKAAAGAGDLKTALAEAARAHTLAAASRRADLVAVAAVAEAFAHLVVDDRAAVQRDVDRGLAAARTGHEPLAAIELRLLGAEVDRRLGHAGRAVMLVRRLQDRRGLPATLAARVELLGELVAGVPPGEAATRLAARTGLRALVLHAPTSGHQAPTAPLTAGIVEILNCCQSADEDRAVLVSLCRCLKARLRALGVAIVREEGSTVVCAVSDGAPIDGGAASRVLAHEHAMLPGAGSSRPIGGAPVRYGGRRLGALVVRWAPTASWDGETGVLLATAAAAAAPAVAGLIDATPRPDPRAHRLLGVSPQIDEVRRSVERAARAPFAVLVLGESGSGKELIARAVHQQSARRDRPFCTLNCAALPDELVESELFGHARGAFTGAVSDRPGVFEEAHTGTLFLDEVGELSPRAQAKVLRTIQDGELRRVGENLSRRVDVRLVAATNRDLTHEVRAGRFRLDLLYRLDVVRVVVPPLRERRDDVVVLAEHFWREATARIGSRATLGAAILAALARYDWPGNVRELQNVLAALAVRSPRRGVVSASALPVCFGNDADTRSCRLDDARRTFERHFIKAALARSGGHRARAALELGVSRQGLTKLIGRLGITDAS